MTERQMEFRVGLFVMAAVCVATVMVFKFGEFGEYLSKGTQITVHFRDAGGIHPSSPVRMSGLQIGVVRDVELDPKNGGVLVKVRIRPQFKVREGSQPRVVTSLLGDAAIDFSPGVGTPELKSNALVPGIAASGPLDVVDRLEDRVATALDVFAQTGREWRNVGSSLNNALAGTDGKQLQRMMQTTMASLEEFARTMRAANRTLSSANQMLSDPKTQTDLRNTLGALPQLVNDTRQAIRAVQMTVQHMDQSMQQIDVAMKPITENSRPMAARLNNTLVNLEAMTAELAQFSKVLRTKDGSLQRLVSDPALYRNLNATAASLSVFLKNAEPVLSDLRIFSDKIARHPELIGVRGVLRGSSGIKQTDYEKR